MEQVFLIPELLELILSNLPQRDLLLAQRVNRTWYEFISRSRLLQQELFLQITRSGSQLYKDLTVDFNPLLQEMFPAFYPDEETLDWEDSCIGTSGDCYQAARELRAQAWFASEAKRQAVLRPDASWRRMFPSDPAPRLGGLNVWLGGCCCGGNTITATFASKYQSVNQEHGPRMGLLWDAIIFVLDDNPDGSFSVSWCKNEDQHEGEGEGDGEKKWSLEWSVETDHQWDCYLCEESYIPTGLKVVDDEDLVYYNEDDHTLMDMEATPLSVRRRNPTEQRAYGPRAMG
ncbi:hypothetical protein BDW66DRAFT_145710 [Aspergillus desertorum]